jgi:hypothetical protein
MKRFLVLCVCVLAACGTDEPQNGANNSNNTTNNSTNNTSNNLMNNQTNNSTTNNATTNTANNVTNNSTNNTVADMGADVAMDAGEEDMGVDAMPDLGPGPDGDLCATAIPIVAGQTIDNQTTVGATDDYEARARDEGCPNNAASGRDRVYIFNTPVAGNFRVTVVPEASFDPALYVRLDCADLVCVNGTILNGEGVQESVTFDATADTDYYLIVDGELGDSGAYSITVQGA